MIAGANDPVMARALSAMARVLDYPSAELQRHAPEVAAAITALPELHPEERAAVAAFVDELASADLFAIQARYGEIFDRGRKVSLYIFEHVYGESRDRGPAMIELKKVYREHGLDSHTRELPDYLPILLEFCAQLPPENALGWLLETRHILQRIRVRLAERNCNYASVFTALLRLLGADPAPEDLTRMAGTESRDDTFAALDEIWQEKPVTFGPDEPHTNCGATRQAPDEPAARHAARSSLGD